MRSNEGIAFVYEAFVVSALKICDMGGCRSGVAVVERVTQWTMTTTLLENVLPDTHARYSLVRCYRKGSVPLHAYANHIQRYVLPSRIEMNIGQLDLAIPDPSFFPLFFSSLQPSIVRDIRYRFVRHPLVSFNRIYETLKSRTR